MHFTLIHSLCAFFVSNSRFMHLFQGALDTLSKAPSPSPSQFTVCTSRFAAGFARLRVFTSFVEVRVNLSGAICRSPKKTHSFCEHQESPRQTKERPVHELFPGAFRNKSSICESCLFSQGKTPEFTEKWAKFVNFSFWPFLWFGLPGRLLIENGRILLCFPQSGGSLESLEALENGLF